LAFSQPIFDIIAQNPEFLAVRDISTTEIYIFTFLVGVFMPCLFVATIFIASNYLRCWGNRVFFIIFAVLVVLIVFPVFRKIYIFPISINIILTLVFSVVICIIYQRYKIIRESLEVL